MNRKERERLVNNCILNAIGMLPTGITEIMPEHYPVDDYGMDSLDVIELIMDCEEVFNIEVSDEDAENCKTVGDIYTLAERLIG